MPVCEPYIGIDVAVSPVENPVTGLGIINLLCLGERSVVENDHWNCILTPNIDHENLCLPPARQFLPFSIEKQMF